MCQTVNSMVDNTRQVAKVIAPPISTGSWDDSMGERYLHLLVVCWAALGRKTEKRRKTGGIGFGVFLT
jgi:hypothetical protein